MSKGPSQPLLAHVSTGAGLPQYQPYPGPYYQAVPVNVRIEVQPYRARRSPLRRFIVSFLIALGIWTLIKVIIVHHRHLGHQMPWDDDWDIPANVVADQCVSDDHFSGSSAEVAYDIPLSPETVLLLSRYRSWSFFGVGSSMSGSLHVTTSTRLHNTAKIVIHSLRRTGVRACLVTGTEGEIGVALFGQKSWWMRFNPSSFMKIDLVLPHTLTPLQLKGIVAELPNFSFDVGSLKGAVDFESVTFRTSNAAIKVESLVASHARLHSSNARITANSFISSDLTISTSNAPISGTYNTSSSLTLATANAPITVSVGLESNDNTRPTTLIMRTSNNRLDAEVTLVTDARKGGDFDINGMTSNGRIAITVPGSPVDSALALTARTSNAAAVVKLHSAYQGSFMVTTSKYPPTVERLDPGDARQFELRVPGQGYVYSKEANKALGRVMVSTSNARAVLAV
ncbi:putative Transmembrane protein [Mycena sanguinolenta]|uniref:Putative Transmembrane protein n=1 Tax=Mycena sanguinolenta TaxID=230812 RepID=A0A8H7CZU5_9AGAR|nr:putative Transmembrane protein [Mycena sanguinolenta]